MKTYEPDTIYLHDPHGVFDADNGGGGIETVQWSQSRISDEDYEYIRNDGWRDAKTVKPKEHDWVLGYSKFGIYYIAKYEAGFWFDWTDTRQNISCWMELPDPPAFI